MALSAAELVSHPLVLRAAWRRIRSWYKRAEWYDPSDLAAVELELPWRLDTIGKTLADGSYAPKPFRLLPYPKKGPKLRHYCTPCAEDQIAFAVFAVLLGPIVDSRLEPFVFGNRLHRRLGPDPSNWKAWKRRSYELDPRYFYMPYRRDHGLFRRVAHWTATAMLRVDSRAVDNRGLLIDPREFEPEALPTCTRRDWWRPRDGAAPRGYWARLDLQLAYPSVTPRLLAQGLEYLVGHPLDWLGAPDDTSDLSAYPRQIRDGLADPGIRAELVRQLLDTLGKVRYDGGAIRPTHWVPDGSDPKLSDSPGLPTGLAISGLLLNAALATADAAIATSMERSRDWAFLRFADDMLALAPDPATLAAALRTIQQAFQGTSEEPSGLRFNLEKVEPHGLANWLEKGTAGVPTAADLEGQDLGPDRLGGFITHLVERMSAIAAGDQTDRFGEAAGRRVQALADLALLDIRDAEVRADTRLLFAANRLATCFLADESDVEASRASLRTIRAGVATALDRAPWKFGVWRAAVRAACRRVAGTRRGNGDQEARQWFSKLLARTSTSRRHHRLLRFGGDRERPSPAVERIERSFLRAIVWREISAALGDLRQAQRLSADGGWSSGSWTFRAADEDQLGSVHAFLADLDRWVRVLYPRGTRDVDRTWWWEWHEIVHLALRQAELTEVAADADIPAALRHAATSRKAGPFLDVLTNAMEVAWPALERNGTAALILPSRNGAPDTLLARLFSDAAETRSVAVAVWQAKAFAAPHLLLEHHARSAFHARSASLWSLEIRAAARQRLLAEVDELRTPRTVHELVSSLPPGIHPRAEGADEAWRLAPAQTPMVPLPVRVAARMLAQAITAELNTARPDYSGGPVPWLVQDARLLAGRAVSFGIKDTRPVEGSSTGAGLITLGRPDDWGALPPHPVIEFPVVLGQSASSLASRVWAHLIQFMVVASGAETQLDALAEFWPSSVPLDERWAHRARISLPSEVWRKLDELQKCILAGSDDRSVAITARELTTLLENDPFHGEVLNDFQAQRIDVDLTGNPGDPLDVPCGIGPPGAPPIVSLSEAHLASDLRVRLGQVVTGTDWTALGSRFHNAGVLRLSRGERQRIMHQVARAFDDADHGRDRNTAIGPVILPEVTVPFEELPSVAALSYARTRAALLGLLWRERPTIAYTPRQRRHGLRFMVNEAALIAPFHHGRINITRAFLVQKPLPAHSELALAQLGGHGHWAFIPGRTWFRFIHDVWGDFGVAICSDLVDPTPWNALQGLVLHLFMVSCNEDIDTFDGLTWIRAFEMHANVVAVNQGDMGGSFVWTPEHGRSKEIARLRGPKLALVADVSLKVKALLDHQRTGVHNAIARAFGNWTRHGVIRTSFKAPPPGYRGRR